MKTLYVYLNTGNYSKECDSHMDALLCRLEMTGDIVNISDRVRDDLHGMTEIEFQCNDWAFRFLKFMNDCDMMCALDYPIAE